MIWGVVKAALAALFSVVAGRLFKPKDPEVVAAHRALDATREEAKELAKPAGTWKETVDEL